jgi:hypothetical protein
MPHMILGRAWLAGPRPDPVRDRARPLAGWLARLRGLLAG